MFLFSCSTLLSLAFVFSPYVSACLSFSRTHSSAWFPHFRFLFSALQPPLYLPCLQSHLHSPQLKQGTFHYVCPTNYSSLIPQFSQLQHSPHNTVLSYSHTYTHHRTPSRSPHPNTHIHKHTHHLQHWDANTRIKDYEYKKRINNEANLEETTISLLFRIIPSEIESLLPHFHFGITKERDRSLFIGQS